jgi:hypothetical protein
MLSSFMLNVAKNFIMLSVILLNVVMLNVVMLSVVAPNKLFTKGNVTDGTINVSKTQGLIQNF